MADSKSIAAFASAGAIAIGLGAWLGSSAIAEIDPIHFSSPIESRFHADLVPQRPDWDEVPLIAARSVPVDHYGLGSGCVKCPEPRYPTRL